MLFNRDDFIPGGYNRRFGLTMDLKINNSQAGQNPQILGAQSDPGRQNGLGFFYVFPGLNDIIQRGNRLENFYGLIIELL